MSWYLKRADGTYSDHHKKAKVKPTDRADGVWVEGSPDGLPVYAPKDMQQQIQALYEALPLDVQEKYEEEILFGAQWLARGNTAMVARKLAKAQAKLDKNNAVELRMFSDISKLLGAS